MLFRVKFGKDSFRSRYVKYSIYIGLISSLLERSHILMELAYSIIRVNGIMRIYREKGKQLDIISKNMVVDIWKFLN